MSGRRKKVTSQKMPGEARATLLPLPAFLLLEFATPPPEGPKLSEIIP